MSFISRVPAAIASSQRPLPIGEAMQRPLHTRGSSKKSVLMELRAAKLGHSAELGPCCVSLSKSPYLPDEPTAAL
jgi:hypothetical protein